MGRSITAYYTNYIQFDIPKGLPLLSVDDAEFCKYGTPWSWFVRYGTLHYFDADRKEHKIEGENQDADYKNADSITEESDNECEEDCEEECCQEEDEDKYLIDHLNLALNWGFCAMEGRHEKTSDKHWVEFNEDHKYNEKTYNRLFKMLSPEQIVIKEKYDAEEKAYEQDKKAVSDDLRYVD